MPNPYSAATNLTQQTGIFTDSAQLVRSAFLYRMIRLDDLPIHAVNHVAGNHAAGCLIIYSGWWFWQRVKVDSRIVWSQVSWISLSRTIQFTIPPTREGDSPRQGGIEIDFAPGLRIKRFRLSVDGQVVFDEIR